MSSAISSRPWDESSAAERSCEHCGLPVRARTLSEPLYCCIGCRLAASIAGGEDGPRRFLEARLLIAAFLAMGVMTFSLVLYGESVYGAERDAAMEVVRIFGRYALAAFSLPVFLLLGVPLIRGALADLRMGWIRMDGLIVLATLAAYGLSIRNTIVQSGEVYYETATMVLVLVLFGRRLEAHARTHGRRAAEMLAESIPRRARILRPEAREVDPAELRPGDHVEIRPGEIVPADVRIERGESEVVAAHVTGEHRAVLARPGTEIPAGAVNGAGWLEGNVLRPQRENAIGKIRRLLDAPLPQTRTMRLADRLAGWLAMIAIVLAFVGGWLAWRRAGAEDAVSTSLAVLLVACPCALGLATPLAFRAIRAALARHGVLVHDPRALEIAATVEDVVLDKTGTLTEIGGEVELGAEADAYRDRLEALMSASGHALGRRVRNGFQRFDDVRLVPGAGVQGRYDGILCRAGSPRWMDREGLDWSAELRARRELWERGGETLVAYAENGAVCAIGKTAQALREGAREAVLGLRARDVRVHVVSGDREAAVTSVAASLGVEAHAGVCPEGKLAFLRSLQEGSGRVLMVGDGVNDAPALRVADVGVAMGTGTGAARASAQIEVLGERLDALPLVLDASNRLRRTVRGNLAWTLVYNGAALGLATAGLLHPLVAVAAMIGSSLAVSVRSYRLLDFARGAA